MRDTLRAAALLSALSLAATAQSTSKENMVRTRGQTRTQDETQTLDRGRIGSEDAVPPNPIVVRGILVDAGCRNRAGYNLKKTPQPVANGGGANQSSALSAEGITVDQRTADAERTDILVHQVPDLRTRQSDPTCAITGNTRAFGLLTDNGRFLDLDEGGNSKAVEAVQGNAAGRKMLNGFGPGIKPRAAIRARIRGDRAVVEELEIAE